MALLLAAAYCAYGTMEYTREPATFNSRSECRAVLPALQTLTSSYIPTVSPTPTPAPVVYSTSPGGSATELRIKKLTS